MYYSDLAAANLPVKPAQGHMKVSVEFLFNQQLVA